MEEDLGTVLNHDRIHSLSIGDIRDQRFDRHRTGPLAELEVQAVETILVLVEQQEPGRS